MAVRRNEIDCSCPASYLLVADRDPHRTASVVRALRAWSRRAPRVIVASGVAEALWVLNREPVRAVLVEHRPAEGASERMMRAIVDGAHGRPVIWLLEDHDVVEVAEAVAAGVSAAFYWDQLGLDLLSAIDRLPLGRGSSDPGSLPTSTHLRRADGRQQNPVSDDSTPSQPYRMVPTRSVSEASTNAA